MRKLKKCPFCGEEAEVIETDITITKIIVVKCMNEDCGGTMANPEENWENKDQAIKAWNNRHVPVSEEDLLITLRKTMGHSNSCNYWIVGENGMTHCNCKVSKVCNAITALIEGKK